MYQLDMSIACASDKFDFKSSRIEYFLQKKRKTVKLINKNKYLNVLLSAIRKCLIKYEEGFYGQINTKKIENHNYFHQVNQSQRRELLK